MQSESLHLPGVIAKADPALVDSQQLGDTLLYLVKYMQVRSALASRRRSHELRTHSCKMPPTICAECVHACTLCRLVCPSHLNNDWSQRVATEQDNPEHPEELMAVREAVKFVQGALQALPLMALDEAGDTL